MKYAIQTWGSNGDIRPMIALADGLIQAGHEVTLAISSIDNKRYDALCHKLGIATFEVSEPIQFDLQDFAQRTLRMNTLQWLQALLEEVFFPYEEAIYQAACELAKTHDAVIGHHILYPLKLAARQFQKPFISILFCHTIVETRHQPPFHLPNLGPWINPLSWRLLDWLFDWLLKKRMSRLWNTHNQPAVEHVINDLLLSDELNLIAVDPIFLTGLKGYAGVHRPAGFLALPDYAEDWVLPDNLQDFIEQGDAPVYCTFGSLQQAVPEWSMELFIDASRILNKRMIIQTSLADYPAGQRSEHCYFIGNHPHLPVFKRCAAVVHHGGAGTSHTATLSGCPSVVIPFMDEQLFWGNQLKQIGVAGKPLKAQQATAERLAKHINSVLNQPQWQITARRLGTIMQSHDGVATAVQLITQLTQPK